MSVWPSPCNTRAVTRDAARALQHGLCLCSRLAFNFAVCGTQATVAREANALCIYYARQRKRELLILNIK